MNFFFFISKNIGLELILFIKNKFKKDITAIVIDKDDKYTIKILKENFKSSKIIIWNKKNKLKNINLLKKLKPKKFFLLWWKYILDEEILKIPTYETINLHPSYLPYFKGKDPNFWSILNNGPYGVSIHRVNKKIDSGPILFRKKFLDIDFTIDAKNLYKDSKKINKKYFESASFVIYTRKHILNKSKYFNYYGYLMEFSKAIDIDSKKDWLNALKLYKLNS